MTETHRTTKELLRTSPDYSQEFHVYPIAGGGGNVICNIYLKDDNCHCRMPFVAVKQNNNNAHGHLYRYPKFAKTLIIITVDITRVEETPPNRRPVTQ